MPYSDPNNALIIVDVQNDFLPGGALGVPNGDQIIPQIQRLAGEHHYVVTTQDWHPIGSRHFEKWPVHCVADTEGAQLAPGIPTADAAFFKGVDTDTDGYSGFQGTLHEGRYWTTGLHTWLHERKVKKVTVVGLALDYCVKATALDAIRYGYQTTVNLRATRPVDDNQTAGVLKELEEAGVRLDK
jgi:nicotinamidase/pyrazinamidase